MRPRLSSRAVRGIHCAILTFAVGGCSTGSEQPFQTASLSSRPETGMSHEPRRPPPPSTYSGPPMEAAPSYSQPSYANNRWRDQPSYTPQPSYAAQPSYQPPYQQPAYQPQYAQQQPAYQPQQSYQPSYQSQNYQQQAYQPQPYQPRSQPVPGPQAQARVAPITTGSLGNSAAKSQTVVVQKGDTLYSLSRRHGVPVAGLVTANRIQDGKINVGQTLVIPKKQSW